MDESQFQKLARGRRMCRSFLCDPLPPGTADSLIETASFAPSAGFTQGWRFLVFEDSAAQQFFNEIFPDRDVHPFPGIFVAPLVIVPLASRDAYLDRYAEPDKGWTDRDPKRWPAEFWTIDAAFASMLILLSAEDLGFGALFFGAKNQSDIKKLDVSEGDWVAIGIIAIGYRADDNRRSSSLKRGKLNVRDLIVRPIEK